MLTAIIADDNEAERAYFCKLLRETKKVEILGEAADGLVALDLVSQLRPDIAFLDIEMPGPKWPSGVPGCVPWTGRSKA
ncbi:MAG: LytR/AlgR family response regulator transcription factor [Moorellaceae bacterium]